MTLFLFVYTAIGGEPPAVLAAITALIDLTILLLVFG
jgi:hypothetical protein